SRRNKRLRSRVAESSKEICFFLENDGNGTELGSGETTNADPAYTSRFSVAGAEPSDSPLLKIVTFQAFSKSPQLDDLLLGIMPSDPDPTRFLWETGFRLNRVAKS
ncbi:hypothetical protein CFOL_v3_06882, partial [Cephalotus follicularis]